MKQKTKYVLTDDAGKYLSVTEKELYEVARYWVDDYNERERMYADAVEDLKERLYHYPSDIDDVREIVEEYMGYLIIECDSHTSAEDIYHQL